MELNTIWIILHIVGVAVGAGGAFSADYIFYQSIRDKKITHTEMSFIENSSRMVWLGLLVLSISGLLLFLEDPEKYTSSSKFITKMIIIIILFINGIFFHTTHAPRLRKNLNKDLRIHFKEKRNIFIFSGSLSGVSWIFAIILGSLREISYSTPEALTIYVIAVLSTFIGALLLQKYYL